MVTLNKTKKSKYVIYIGWALKVYAEYQNETNDMIYKYGREKIEIERI